MPEKKNTNSRKKGEKRSLLHFESSQAQAHSGSVVLFAVAVLLLCLALVQGTAWWYVIHQFLKGMFGWSLVFLIASLIYIALKLDHEESVERVRDYAVTAVIGAVVFSGFLEVVLGGGRVQSMDIVQAAKLLYEEGQQWRGGGLLSAVIALPLVGIMGDTGAKILMALAMFVTLMDLFRLRLQDLVNPISTFFRFLFTDRADARMIREYEEADEEDIYERDLEESEEAAVTILKKPRRRRRDLSETQPIEIPIEFFEESHDRSPLDAELPSSVQIDISLDDAELASQKGEVASTLKQSEESVRSEKDEESGDEALEALIRKATEKPKKKSKEELREESVHAIEEEIVQQSVTLEPQEDYQMPDMEFLQRGRSHADDPNAYHELREKADQLTGVLQSFNVSVKITNIARGPSVTRYEVQPAAGVKVSKITGLADDIALNLAAQGVRIEAPIPGKAAVGVEVPNSKRDVVSLREVLDTEQFQKSRSKLSFAVGKDIAGNIILGDIEKMPHTIIAGTTGSGKSVCTNSIIMSILYHALPTEVKLILIDPKIVEFRIYDGIPHLLIPVVTDPKKAAGALNWAVQEMLRRYQVFAETNVRNLGDYNQLCKRVPEMQLEPMPQIVIAIDELADLMMASSKDVEESICRLAQMARAAGMHLIIATQRPTTDIITGLIKANIPSRIALSVKSQVDSRTILDVGGAEKLLGNGDMLYLPNGSPKPIRVQGCYVSTEEIERVVSFIRGQSETEYDESIIQAVDQITASSESAGIGVEEEGQPESDEAIFEKAIEMVVYAGQASTSNLQRRLKLGYARAARIMDMLEEAGIIGPYEGARPRRVILTREQFEERKLRRLNEQ